MSLPLSRCFCDFFRRINFIRRLDLRRLLLVLCLGFVAQADKHGKVVRAKVREALKLDEPKVCRVKEMIERKAQKKITRVK